MITASLDVDTDFESTRAAITSLIEQGQVAGETRSLLAEATAALGAQDGETACSLVRQASLRIGRRLNPCTWFFLQVMCAQIALATRSAEGRRRRKEALQYLDSASDILDGLSNAKENPEVTQFAFSTWSTIGSLHMRLSREGHPDSEELAVRAYFRALALVDEDSDQDLWTKAASNLNVALYWRRRRPQDIGPYTTDPIGGLQKVIRVLERRDSESELAYAQINLGHAYLLTASTDDIPALVNAWRAYRQAWHSLNGRGDEVGASSVLTYLVRALLSFPTLDADGVNETLQLEMEWLIQELQRAADTFALAGMPSQVARTHSLMGVAYHILIRAGRTELGEDAEACLLSALDEQRLDNDPEALRLSAYRLGLVREALGRWTDALDAYEIALEAGRMLWTGAVTESSLLIESEGDYEISSHAVLCALQQDPPDRKRALLLAEAGRSRLLHALLSRVEIPRPASLTSQEIATEAELRSTLRELHDRIRHAVENADRADAVQKALRANEGYRRLLKSLEGRPDTREYVAFRRAEPCSWTEIQIWLGMHEPRSDLLAYVDLPASVAVIVVSGSDHDLRHEVFPVTPQELERRADAFVHALDRSDDPQYGETQWREISTEFTPTLEAEPNQVLPLWIVPSPSLSTLPLHAMYDNDEPLIRKRAVSLTPSITLQVRNAWKCSMESFPGSATASTGLVIVGEAPDLEYAVQEAEGLAGRYGVPILRGSAATAADLREHSWIHFAGHANFDGYDPWKSRLDLSGNHTLTAYDVLANGSNTALLTLAGCGTGRQGIDRGGNASGLSAAALAVGVNTVLASLWSVFDGETAALVDSFYSALFDEGGNQRCSAAESLHRAVLEVSGMGAHFAEWAPMAVFGD